VSQRYGAGQTPISTTLAPRASGKAAAVQFIVLNEDDFKQEYRKAFQKQELNTEAEREQFRDEVFSVQGAVEEALTRKWKPTDDFAVAWDFNYCYHTCGGIYSEEIFCAEYVATVLDALRSVDPEGRWTYHTVCEITVNPAGKTPAESTEDRGEFFVRGGACYINGSTMKPAWRKRIGCRE
jgi:hypothetical protein